MNKETLFISIQGINREIDKRKSVLHNMRYYLRNPGRSGPQYSVDYIYENGPRLALEIWKLRLILVDMFFIYDKKMLLERNPMRYEVF